MQIVKDIPPAENEEKIKSSENIEQIADVKTSDERKVETKNSVFIPEIINSNSAVTDNKSIFASLPNINNLQILETMVTVPIRSDSVQYGTIL